MLISDLSNPSKLHEEMEKMNLIKLRPDTLTWQADFYLNGRRIRKTLPFKEERINGIKNKALAEHSAKALYLQYRTGELDIRNSSTLNEAIKEYQSRKNIDHCYRTNILSERLGNKSINQISRHDISDLINYLRDERNNTNQSINKYLGHLRAILNLMVRLGWVNSFVPIISLPLDPKRIKKRRALTPDEESRLWEAIPDELKDFIEFTESVGLRKSNAVNLKKKHLIMGSNGRYSIHFEPEEYKTRTPKIFELTLRETEIIKRNISFEYEYIFRRPNGKPIGDFKKAWATVMKKANIKSDFKADFHILRHTRATKLAKEGFNRWEINKAMGWARNSRMADQYIDENQIEVTSKREKLERKKTLHGHGHILTENKKNL